MADTTLSITLTLEGVSLFAKALRYQEEVPEDVNDPDKGMIPNPQSRADFLQDKLIEYADENIRTVTINDAVDATIETTKSEIDMSTKIKENVEAVAPVIEK